MRPGNILTSLFGDGVHRGLRVGALALCLGIYRDEIVIAMLADGSIICCSIGAWKWW